MINLDNDYSINRSKLSFNINDINLVLRVSDIKDTIKTDKKQRRTMHIRAALEAGFEKVG